MRHRHPRLVGLQPKPVQRDVNKQINILLSDRLSWQFLNLQADSFARQDYFFHKEGVANGGNRYLTVGGWVGRWLGGWVASWLGGWVAGWLPGWVAGWAGGWVAGWAGGWVGVHMVSLAPNRCGFDHARAAGASLHWDDLGCPAFVSDQVLTYLNDVEEGKQHSAWHKCRLSQALQRRGPGRAVPSCLGS